MRSFRLFYRTNLVQLNNNLIRLTGPLVLDPGWSIHCCIQKVNKIWWTYFRTRCLTDQATENDSCTQWPM